jgi:predicted nicotinamide N-methyase
MAKGKQGYGSARPSLQRKLTRRDEQRAMVSRTRQRQKRQEQEPPWWARRRTPGQAQ